LGDDLVERAPLLQRPPLRLSVAAQAQQQLCVRQFGGEDLDVALDQVREPIDRAAEPSRRW